MATKLRDDVNRLHQYCLTSLLLLLLIFTATINTSAQEEDFGGYYSITVKHDINKWLSAAITPEIRFNENHSELEMALIEGDVSAKLNKHFNLGGYYRFGVKQVNPDYEERIHRLGVYGKASYRLKPFDLSYRCMFMEQYTNIHSSENGMVPEKVLRHKLSVQYSKKKYAIEPFAYGELYQTLAPESKDGHLKFKFSAGADYKINKMLTASLGYMRQTQLNVPNPETKNIITTEIKLKF